MRCDFLGGIDIFRKKIPRREMMQDLLSKINICQDTSMQITDTLKTGKDDESQKAILAAYVFSLYPLTLLEG